MVSRPRLRLVAWLVLAAGLLAIQASFRAPRGIFWDTVFDAGHVLLFVLLSLLLLRISWILARLTDRRRPYHYVLPFGGVVLLAVLTEALQIRGPRDADLGDGMRNLAGGISALLLTLACDQKAWKPSRVQRALLIACALALLAVPAIPFATTVGAYLGRNRAFPVLCAFQASWEKRFVSVKEGSLLAVSPPAGWSRDGVTPVARITLLPGRYPGLAIAEPRPDWTGYDLLAFDVFSDAPDRFELVLRVHDASHDNRYEDRFNRSMVVQPGLNRFRVPLSEVRNGPGSRKMDLERIRGLALFANHPRQTITFYVDSIRLERL